MSSPPAIIEATSSPGNLGLLERAQALAALQDREAVGDRIGVVDVVGDEDHPYALVAGLGDVA